MTDLNKIPEKYMNEAVERLMKTGIYSLKEATEIAIDDWRIDHKERCEWEPTEEEEKAMHKANKVVGRSPKQKDPGAPKAKRERKEDTVKRDLIQVLAAALGSSAEDILITNPERVIAFNVGDDSFELTLTKKRKK